MMNDYKDLYFSLLNDLSELKNTIERIEEKSEKIRHFIEDGDSVEKNVYYPRTYGNRKLFEK